MSVSFNSKKVGLLAGVVFFLVICFFPIQSLSENGNYVIAVALWMVTWWITEAVSISVTALLPLLLFPLLKIMPLSDVSANYGSPIVFLFFGGFVLALALEKVNLHRRIALSIIKRTGTTPNRVILGFMIATGFMSMWISNTASTVVMLPIGLSVIHLLIDDEDGFTQQDKKFALSILLGIAFSANAGGIATVIGTPPNSVLIGLLENEYNIEISFLKWMLVGLPFSVILITVIYLFFTKVFFVNKGINFTASQSIIDSELEKLGKITKEEKRVLLVFGFTILLWIFRSLINSVFPDLGLSDTLISILGALALFTIPLDFSKNGKFVLEWADTKKLAWGILILFGGGLALAKGMSTSGVVDIVAQLISQSDSSIALTAFLLIALMLFMTEFMSNVALVAVLAPVVAGIAIGLDIPLLHLLIPVTIASSCAFMMPMSTPPNAIVFASGHIKVSEMAKTGFLLNIVSIVLLVVLFFILRVTL